MRGEKDRTPRDMHRYIYIALCTSAQTFEVHDVRTHHNDLAELIFDVSSEY